MKEEVEGKEKKEEEAEKVGKETKEEGEEEEETEKKKTEKESAGDDKEEQKKETHRQRFQWIGVQTSELEDELSTLSRPARSEHDSPACQGLLILALAQGLEAWLPTCSNGL